MAWYWIVAIVVGAVWAVGFYACSYPCEHEPGGFCGQCWKRRAMWWVAIPFRLIPVYLPRLIVWLLETALPDLLQESINAWVPERKQEKRDA